MSDEPHAPSPRAAGAPHTSAADAPGTAAAVVWHDLECGRYTADLPLWRELAEEARARASAAALLDVGAGSGRVTLDLAGRGHRVLALDRDKLLLGALGERAAGKPVETVCADARTFDLARVGFSLCIAPMQTVQLLHGWSGRLAFMRRARAHLLHGGVLACAVVTELEPFDCADGDLGPSLEIARVGRHDYVSRATRLRVGAGTIRIERERYVLPAGHAETGAQPPAELDVVELDRVSVEQLQREAREAGLSPVAVREIPETSEHTASQVVILRA